MKCLAHNTNNSIQLFNVWEVNRPEYFPRGAGNSSMLSIARGQRSSMNTLECLFKTEGESFVCLTWFNSFFPGQFRLICRNQSRPNCLNPGFFPTYSLSFLRWSRYLTLIFATPLFYVRLYHNVTSFHLDSRNFSFSVELQKLYFISSKVKTYYCTIELV